MKINFAEIEQKWREKWKNAQLFKAEDNSNKPKSYLLIEFPYPSGDGLHVGHTRPYTAMDTVARCRRMKGYNVLFPFGWDAFGLPTENYAIKNHVHPETVTRERIEMFKAQTDALGYSFDWSREVNTTDPEYYKWTQWIFLQLFNRGLAYKTKMPVNWCTNCKCVLANEEVVDGACERCGSGVVRREKSQWMLKITDYAQKLIDGLENLDYLDRIKVQQRNWIGRSDGAEVHFSTSAGDDLTVFTTRPDTLFGVTYMVLSPEHPYIERWRGRLKNIDQVIAYQVIASKKSDFERTELAKDKTGVKLEGICAINPVNGQEIPIFISDYVLMSYGTGAIMAVPGHDERDWEFAKKFEIPIVEVVKGGDVESAAYTDCDSGIMVNSGFLDNLSVDRAKEKIAEWLEKEHKGAKKINYKLRDWVFARQRYWGEPIPIVHCPHCGMVALDECELPLKLPQVESYQTTDDGESPLKNLREWVEVKCPKCGADAERETDTMPQWAGSSWYYLRYCDPKNPETLAAPQKLKYWLPVDWYNGGMEHVTLHLLYSRFWHKFLYDIGVVPTPEPYQKRTAHGMILGEDGMKMSKSRGNVVSPTDVINQYCSDTMRLYIMFIGDFEKAATWSSQAVKGCHRFLERVFSVAESTLSTDRDATLSTDIETLLHKTIKKVTEDIEKLKFNTAIAQLMTLLNEFSAKGASKAEINIFLRLLAPFAPHSADELWERLGFDGFASAAAWPEFDPDKCADSDVEIAVQINGKLRASVKCAAGIEDEELLKIVLSDPKIANQVAEKTIMRKIIVKNKIVNLVVM